MNIAVISPHTRRNGNTTIASLLALELSTRGMTVCLTHTAMRSPAMYEYFSLRETDGDKTANPSKLVAMLQAGAVKPEEIPEYCKNITTGVDAFTVNDKKFTQKDINYAVEYILDKFPYELKVFDIDETMEEEIVKKVLGKCDFIVLVVTQSLMELHDFRQEIKKLEKLLKYKPSMVVVNKFERKVCSVQDLQRDLGMKVSKKSAWVTVRYNTEVIRYERHRRLLDLFNAFRKQDVAVLDVANDMKQIANRVMKCRQQGRITKAKNETEELKKKTDTMEILTGKDGGSKDGES